MRPSKNDGDGSEYDERECDTSQNVLSGASCTKSIKDRCSQALQSDELILIRQRDLEDRATPHCFFERGNINNTERAEQQSDGPGYRHRPRGSVDNEKNASV